MRPDTLDRMVHAVEKVRSRLSRATAALERAGVPYAVVGGNAVAVWVAQVDEAAVRNTQDVDLLLRRADLAAAREALGSAGFVYRHAAAVDMFLDVHVVFAGERVRPDDPEPAPDVADSVDTGSFRTLALESLVRMKLTSFRLKDRVHLLDMLGVGLIDESWLGRLPAELARRLADLIENPEQ